MTPTPEAWEDLNARLEAVEGQRNRALTEAAVAHGRWSVTAMKLTEAQQQMEKFKTDVATLNERLAALVKPEGG